MFTMLRCMQMKSINNSFPSSPPAGSFNYCPLLTVTDNMTMTILCSQLFVSLGLFLKYEFLKLELPGQRKGSFIWGSVLTLKWRGWNFSKMIPWPKGSNADARQSPQSSPSFVFCLGVLLFPCKYLQCSSAPGPPTPWLRANSGETTELRLYKSSCFIIGLCFKLLLLRLCFKLLLFQRRKIPVLTELS